MNTNTPTKRLQSLGTALLFSVPALLATQAASAQTQIINWGGDYVSGTAEFAGKFTDNTVGGDNGYGGFSGGEPAELTPGSGYTGGAIYGYIQELNNGGSTIAPNGVIQNGSNDRILLKSDDGAQHAAFLLLWQQADFLNGGNSATVFFNTDSSVRMYTPTYVGQHAEDSGRLVLKLNDGNYYVSEQIFTSNADTTIADLINIDYFAYDPASALELNNDSLIEANIVNDGLISGITSVGFYFETDGVSNSNAIRLQNFEVNASVIPEPSTYAMIFGGLALALAMVWRRQKNG